MGNASGHEAAEACESDVELAQPRRRHGGDGIGDVAIGHPISENILWHLDEAYGHRVSELGYETEGHLCLTDADVEVAKVARSSLLYGEVLPHGVVKVLDDKHLNAATSRHLFDLGSGTGKLCMQGLCCSCLARCVRAREQLRVLL